jgi:hypothetical protein
MDMDLLRNIAAWGGIVSVIITIARFVRDSSRSVEEKDKRISKLVNESNKLIKDFKALGYIVNNIAGMDSPEYDRLVSIHIEIEAKWNEIAIEASDKDWATSYLQSLDRKMLDECEYWWLAKP